MYWQSHVKLLDAAKYRTGLMFRRAQNGKPGHTNLLILKRPYDSYRIVAIYKQTNKHVQLKILVTQVTCTWICRS